MPRWFGRLLLTAGLALLLSPLVISAYSAYQQRRLESQLNSAAAVEPATADDPTMSAPVTGTPPNPAPPDAAPAPTTKPLTPPFRIRIPKLNLDAVVVNGVAAADLRRGPGLYPQGALPGAGSNAAIAGHRTTYGAWFRHVDELRPGDEIVLAGTDGDLVYKVERVFIVAKNDWSVIAPTPYPALTLTTCDPPGSASHRLIVRARLETAGTAAGANATTAASAPRPQQMQQ